MAVDRNEKMNSCIIRIVSYPLFGFDESKMTHGSANDVKDVNAVNEVNNGKDGKDANTMDVKQVNGALWCPMEQYGA